VKDLDREKIFSRRDAEKGKGKSKRTYLAQRRRDAEKAENKGTCLTQRRNAATGGKESKGKSMFHTETQSQRRKANRGKKPRKVSHALTPSIPQFLNSSIPKFRTRFFSDTSVALVNPGTG
jgi:hypothetical protein